MRKRAILASSVTSAVVLVAGWQMGSQGEQSLANGSAKTTVPVSGAGAGTTPTPTDSPASGTTSPGSTAAPTTAPTPSPSPSAGAASGGSTGSSAASGTFTGTVEQTQFGSVQVQITVSNGQITDVTALKLTDAERRSVQISNRAAPILRSEVLAAQSANVQSVSGATYTSDAYLASLQSAIDQAGL